MAKLHPYLNFNGKCSEAMTFYQECLGGELVMQKISESPMGAQLSSVQGAGILHSSLSNNGLVLMGSDMMGANLITGNSVTLCLQGGDEDEISVFFDKLSIGGSVRMPLHQTFWGATYGELTDKYGVNWMFNHTKAQ
jgi:PhnB protein